MNYPSIRIEGAILSPDILDQIEELPGQQPSDFALDAGIKVKDEIARAWADSQDYWRIFQRKLEAVKEGSNATTETRNLWMVPLLGLLRYDIEYQARGVELDGRIYSISHRATNRADASVQIIGARDPAGLDKKPANATRRMSAHALVQEFLNLHDQLYGLVTDGHVLRLLRDSSRLVKQSYLEFDLDRIFTDGLFADFAILYRLLHATRLPLTNDTAAESLIERYHQDSLDSGARIREGLSKAVEQAILDFGNGFLSLAENEALSTAVANGELSASDYYQQLLRLIYRLLFLMVIEERDLLFPPEAQRAQRDIHRKFYSVSRLRHLSEKRYLADPRRHDLWLALQSCFRLFEADGPGAKLGIAPLAGDLFSAEALGSLAGCTLSNDVLLGSLRSLGLYRHPDSRQLIRVNYAALNVEEFGSVYEGLLEYEPEFTNEGGKLRFGFRRGDQRAATGSHYTPDDLVQPLIRHSLDHLIAERLKSDDLEAALLDLRVADVACGSGHILLAAARRIATELAVVRTGEEQPSPPAYRAALRDVIRHSIYGVDINPLAVELCKVALWLEAHIPGQPLNFLDHHIKCGNAIVGFARREELGQGVPTEAFKTLPGDDKEVAADHRKQNRKDLRQRQQVSLDFTTEMRGHMDAVLDEWRSVSALPEQNPDQVNTKKERFAAFSRGAHADLLQTIADIPLAQFFIPKVSGHEAELVTDREFRNYWRGQVAPDGRAPNAARELAERERFFHWFLEFPEIMERGGFDCILGNPPYLGDKKQKRSYGAPFQVATRWLFSLESACDVVAIFYRRIFDLLQPEGLAVLISTNTIAQGATREQGLDTILASGGTIHYAAPSVQWPGRANVVVSIVGFSKGTMLGPYPLDGRSVLGITGGLRERMEENQAKPKQLKANRGIAFIGTYVNGTGFFLDFSTASTLITRNPYTRDVIRRHTNGDDLYDDVLQKGSRYVIDFGSRSIEEAERYTECFEIVRSRVFPIRTKQGDQRNREKWWLHARPRRKLYTAIHKFSRVLAAAKVSRTCAVDYVPADEVLDEKLIVFALDGYDAFAFLQSCFHWEWAWFRCTTMKHDVSYGVQRIFLTLPLPLDFSTARDASMQKVGEQYHDHRKGIMQDLRLGLTTTYNLFHTRDLSLAAVGKASKSDSDTAASCLRNLLELRRLHVALDLAVRDAYGWQDLDLAHDFYEVEYLPENDRVRYTISPIARREVLRRLLVENHARAEAEAQNPPPKSTHGRRKQSAVDVTANLFTGKS